MSHAHWHQEDLQAYKVRQKKGGDNLSPVDIADDGKEADLMRKIARYLDEHGIYGVHDKSRGINEKGIPDWILALPHGRVVFIECKSKTGRLSDEQKLVKLKLLGAGHEFYECRSYKRFLEIVLDTSGE